MVKKEKYDESSIKVLKDLEPVQQRPGMYTRLESPTHIILEVIDNACDEALAGFANKIKVKVHDDHSVSVSDNGRGIPVGKHQIEKVSVVQLVFTKLHSGGKFNKSNSSSAYKYSGGLHGVGVSVTNALSDKLEVRVCRDGGEYFMSFNKGIVDSPLSKIGNSDTTGTIVTAWPTTSYFEQPHVDLNELETVLRAKAMLLPGIEIEFSSPGKEAIVWHYPEGMTQYLRDVSGDSEWITPIVSISGKETINDMEDGLNCSLGFISEGGTHKESFVNLIPTKDGGKHMQGFRYGVFMAVQQFMDRQGLIPKQLKLEYDDVWSRISCVLAMQMVDPQFQGQVKDQLSSKHAHKLVEQIIATKFENWLHENQNYAKQIAELIIEQAQKRAKSNAKVERKKGNSGAVLPGKLSDCESSDVNKTELFLCEGDSASGSAKMGRDRKFQAILPLRGKISNTWGMESEHLDGKTIEDIIIAIGVEPHKVGDKNALASLRYGKIIIQSDADVDGSHIQVLLTTLFFKHFPELVLQGHLYIAKPPLFRIDAPFSKKVKNPMRKLYAIDQNELNAILSDLKKEGITDNQITINRFKGLGEMNAEQLYETTMQESSRRLIKPILNVKNKDSVFNTFDMMMNEKKSSMRREWMEKDGDKANMDI